MPVEVGGVGDAVDLRAELSDFLLKLLAVGAVLKGAVGGLLSQLIHAVEHVVDLGEGALGGLHQGDTVLGVVLGVDGGGVAADQGSMVLTTCGVEDDVAMDTVPDSGPGRPPRSGCPRCAVASC